MILDRQREEAIERDSVEGEKSRGANGHSSASRRKRQWSRSAVDVMSAGGTDEKEASSIDASKTKAELIVEACKWRNISELRELAISPGGFLTDELRRQACR